MGVEAQHPVADGLQTDPANPRRGRAGASVEDRSEREKPARLRRVLRALRKPSTNKAVEKQHRAAVMANFPVVHIMNSDSQGLGNSQCESVSAWVGFISKDQLGKKRNWNAEYQIKNCMHQVRSMLFC